MEAPFQIADDSYLRLLEEVDAGELYELIEANRARLAQWLPWAAAQSFEDTLDFIRGTRAQVRKTKAFRPP